MALVWVASVTPHFLASAASLSLRPLLPEPLAFVYAPSSTVAGVVSLYVLPSSATEPLPPPTRKYAPPAITARATTDTPTTRPVFFLGAPAGGPGGYWPP